MNFPTTNGYQVRRSTTSTFAAAPDRQEPDPLHEPSTIPFSSTPMMGLDDVAKHLGVSTKTIRRQIKAGKLPVIRIGTAVRIAADDLQRFIADARHVRLTPRNGKSKA